MSHKNRAITRWFAVFLCLIFFLPYTVHALDDPSPQAEAAYLADRESGFVLYSKNADARRFPASTTKVMTALIVLEKVDNLAQTVEVLDEDFDDVAFDSSKAGFLPGEQVPVLDLLYGLLLPSGNEAANTLARYVGGDGAKEEFVRMMNARAKELGCTNTRFVNPNGLHDENHYTTARDLYTIAREAMKNDTFQEIANTAQKTLQETNKTPERGGKPLKVLTTNMLIFSRNQAVQYYAYAKGVKTGYTSQAGYCLVAASEKRGGKLLSVMLGCEKPQGAAHAVSFAETKRLFDWGYDNFATMELIEKGETVTQIEVRLSTEDDQLVLVTRDSLSGTVPKDIDLNDITRKLEIPASVDAPIKAGDKLGYMEISYNNVDYGTVDLVALSDISRSDVLYYTDKIENFFHGSLFKILVVGIVVLFFVYFMLLLYRARRRRMRRRQMMKSKQARYRDYDRHDR